MKTCCEKCGYPTDEWQIINGKYYCIDCLEELEEKEIADEAYKEYLKNPKTYSLDEIKKDLEMN